jgi:hypothetical protein
VHAEAHAICRVVQPERTEGDTSALEFDPTTMVLYVLAPDQVIGYECRTQRAPRDGGVVRPPDAGVTADGGLDAAVESGTPSDGAVTDGVVATDAMAMPLDGAVSMDAMAPDGAVDTAEGDDGGLPPMLSEDAGTGDAAVGSMVPEPEMTCPEGTIAVAMWGTVTHMVIQPRIVASDGEAALVMPVPARPDVHLAEADLFRRVGELMAPLVSYRTVEVPDASLGYQCHDPAWSGGSSPSSGSVGCGGDDDWSYTEDPSYSGGSSTTTGGFYDPDTDRRTTRTVQTGVGIVEVAEVIATDDYTVTAIRADAPNALLTWLDDNGFAHSEEDDVAFSYYAKEGAWFLAVKVHGSSRSTRRVVGLQPLVVSYPSAEIPLMHRLQFRAEGGTAYTDAFVMAPDRMDSADGSSHTQYAAATDLESIGTMFGLSSGWLTRLGITRVMNVDKDDSFLRPVANAPVRPTIEHITEISIPAPCPSGGSWTDSTRTTSDDDGGCGCASANLGRSGIGALLPVAFVLLFLGVRRRRR